jgi:hypothetical protein
LRFPSDTSEIDLQWAYCAGTISQSPIKVEKERPPPNNSPGWEEKADFNLEKFVSQIARLGRLSAEAATYAKREFGDHAG